MMRAAVICVLVSATALAQTHGSVGSGHIAGQVLSAPQHNVTLTWVASIGATDYRVYRSTTPGTETALADAGNNLTFIDTNVTAGQTYYYTVTAVAPAGAGSGTAESGFSNEAAVTVPSP